MSSTAAAVGDLRGADRGLRYLAYAMVGIILLFMMIDQLVWTIRAGGIWGFLLAVIAAGLPLPISAALILWLDKHEHEPAPLLLAAFFWGAVVAIFLSGIFNSLFAQVVKMGFGKQIAELLTAPISAPIVEETAKGIAVLLLALTARKEFDNALDGLIYGAMVGLGFEVAENVGYFVGEFREGGLGALAASFYVRVILGSLGHSIYTGLTGYGIGLARESDKPTTRAIAPLAGFLAAMLLHAMWNGLSTIIGSVLFKGAEFSRAVWLLVIMPIQSLGQTIPQVIFIMVIASMAWRRESKIIAEHLRDEQASGAITAEEYAVISSARERRRRLLRTLMGRGLGAWLALRRLYDLQTELAFRKWHVMRGEWMPAEQRETSEETFRAQIRALRTQLRAMGVATA